MDEQNDKITRLEVDKAMLQEQIKNFSQKIKGTRKMQKNQSNLVEGSVFEQMESPQKKKKQAKMFYKRLGHYAVMQKWISQIWYMIELIGFVKPIMTKELMKSAKVLQFVSKVLQFVSQPCITEQWHTGQKRK